MDKGYRKRYLLTLLALLVTGFALFSAVLVALNTSHKLNMPNLFTLAALCALIPAGSYAGFVTAGTRIGDITAKKAALIILFFPLLLAGVTVFGIIILLPSMVKSITVLIRG